MDIIPIKILEDLDKTPIESFVTMITSSITDSVGETKAEHLGILYEKGKEDFSTLQQVITSEPQNIARIRYSFSTDKPGEVIQGDVDYPLTDLEYQRYDQMFVKLGEEQ